MSNNYNPFDLQPPKDAVKSGLLQLQKKATKCLEVIAMLRQYPWAEWLLEEKIDLHQQLVHMIHWYQSYLNDRSVDQNWGNAKVTAKNRTLVDFYPGKLRKLGKRFVGKCPFHKDDSPSFIIYSNNTYYCFGCLAWGDTIAFIQRLHNLTFKEAINFLQ